MGKKILVFADGTGQIGGQRPEQPLTNVYKLYQAMKCGPDSPIDPHVQVAFYDPGIGTLSADSHVRVTLWNRFVRALSLLTGFGFSRNVVNCYEAILKYYQPGDKIYLFGFSRGAYTVRAVANVLNLCGIPTKDASGRQLPRAGNALTRISEEAVHRVYNHGAGSKRAKYEDQREQLAREFRQRYRSGSHPNRGDVYPEAICVFDAVAALGFPAWVRRSVLVFGAGLTLGLLIVAAYLVAGGINNYFYILALGLSAAVGLGVFSTARGHLIHYAPESISAPKKRHWAIWSSENYDQFLDKRIELVRHALAIDEDRKSFDRVGWGTKGKDYGNCARTGRLRFLQVWFAGNHSDIGGSYPENESRLSDIALDWMIEEILAHDPDIQMNDNKLHRFPDPLGVQHSQLADWIERAPLLQVFFERWGRGLRKIDEMAKLHPSVISRLRASEVLHRDQMRPYCPANITGCEAAKRALS